MLYYLTMETAAPGVLEPRSVATSGRQHQYHLQSLMSNNKYMSI